MRYYKVPVYLESSLKEIKEDSVVIYTNAGNVEIPADTVIASIGYEPFNPFGAQESEYVHLLGDAAKVGNLKTAIWAADDLVLGF